MICLEEIGRKWGQVTEYGAETEALAKHLQCQLEYLL